MWVETHVSGAAYSTVPIVFSADSKLYFAAVEKSVKVVSVATCDVVRTIQVADTVTSVGVSADNVAQLVTTSHDGFVRFWDFEDGILLREHNVGVLIESAVLHRSLGNVLFVISSGRYENSAGGNNNNNNNNSSSSSSSIALTASSDLLSPSSVRSIRRSTTEDDGAFDDHRHDVHDDDDENDNDTPQHEADGLSSSARAQSDARRRVTRYRDRLWRVLRCELPSSETTTTTNSTVVTTQTLFKVRHGMALHLSADSRHVVCVAGTIVKLFDTHQRMLRSFQSKLAVTCVAVSPSLVDGIVAVGDIAGHIALWRCLANDTCVLPQAKCLVTTMHWHAHAVTALQFNPDGDYLYSGGTEGVLLSWQLRSGARTFLPRLGAALVSVAASRDGRWLAAACMSNQVCFFPFLFCLSK